jgi:hypothetical protein
MQRYWGSRFVRGLLFRCRLSRLSGQVTDLTVKELDLRDEFGGEPSVAIVDQRGLTTKTCQLELQSVDAATKRISFSD